MRALFIGRFQPFHAGHLAVLETIRQRHPHHSVLLGIGSAQASYTWENPFTAGERAEMIGAAISAAGLDRIEWVPIPDIHQHALWVAHVRALVPAFERVVTNNPLTAELFGRDGVAVEATEWVDRARLEGRAIRERLAEGRPVTDRVPKAVADWLESHRAGERLRMLRRAPEVPRERDAR